MSEVIRTEIRLVVDYCDRTGGCICQPIDTGRCRHSRRKTARDIESVDELQRLLDKVQPSTLF